MNYYFFIPLLLLVVVIPALFKALKELKQVEETQEIERSLPDVLLAISANNSRTFEEMIATGAKQSSPAGSLFKKCSLLIARGAPVETALLQSFNSTSPSIKKTGELLHKVYVNGNSLLELLREFALDLSSFNEARESAKASSSLQKYSVLVSAGVLVPAIMAFTYSVSQKASLVLSPDLGVPFFVLVSINIYLVLFSLLASRFLARQFYSHFFTFFSLTCPLSLFVFNSLLLVLAV